MGRRIDDTTGGNSGVEPRLGVMYTEMVVRRGYSLPRYVDLVSPTPLRSWGFYPRKGALAAAATPTSPSSIPPAVARCAPTTLHETDYTPVGGPRHLRLAGGDDPARQGGG